MGSSSSFSFREKDSKTMTNSGCDSGAKRSAGSLSLKGEKKDEAPSSLFRPIVEASPVSYNFEQVNTTHIITESSLPIVQQVPALLNHDSDLTEVTKILVKLILFFFFAFCFLSHNHFSF